MKRRMACLLLAFSYHFYDVFPWKVSDFSYTSHRFELVYSVHILWKSDWDATLLSWSSLSFRSPNEIPLNTVCHFIIFRCCSIVVTRLSSIWLQILSFWIREVVFFFFTCSILFLWNWPEDRPYNTFVSLKCPLSHMIVSSPPFCIHVHLIRCRKMARRDPRILAYQSISRITCSLQLLHTVFTLWLRFLSGKVPFEWVFFSPLGTGWYTMINLLARHWLPASALLRWSR